MYSKLPRKQDDRHPSLQRLVTCYSSPLVRFHYTFARIIRFGPGGERMSRNGVGMEILTIEWYVRRLIGYKHLGPSTLGSTSV